MEELDRDVLYLANTRPSMKMGVPFEGFMLNFCGTFLIGMWLGSPVYWIIGLALHFPLRVLTAWDHNFFRIGRLWLVTKGASTGSHLWGGSSLSPLPCGLPKRAREVSCAL